MPRPHFAFAGLAACLLVAGAIGYSTFWLPGSGTEELRMAAAQPDNRAAEWRLPKEESRTAEEASGRAVPVGPPSQPATPPPEHRSEARGMERSPTEEERRHKEAWERLQKEQRARSSEQFSRYILQYPASESFPRAKKSATEAPPAAYPQRGGDRFAPFDENPVKRAAEDPVSTFSIDVDTASYGFMRASLNRGVLPPKNAVRTEELVNYFPYGYAPPKDRDTPFAIHASMMPTPWNDATRLMHIGIKGYVPERESRPRANLVFLIDSSGSMDEPDKLPLLKTSFKLLLGALAPEDRVAIVTYAGAAGTVLPPTEAAERAKIAAALDRLDAGGSTAGAEGIRQAYLLAEQHFVEDGINRVILATDGDFNVGIADPEQLEGYIARKRDSGVYLSVLGFGMGNYNDALMQRLAQSGNGNAAYIDSLSEARKVLVEEAGSTLFPIAKDVKIQVEFNPALDRRIPADRLRDPDARPRGLPQRQGGRRRDRRRPHGDRALRDRARGLGRRAHAAAALRDPASAAGRRVGERARHRLHPLQEARRREEREDRPPRHPGGRAREGRGRARGCPLRRRGRCVRADPARRALHPGLRP